MKFDKHARLVDKLLALTESGGIEWKTAVGEDEFQVSFKDNSVRIRRSETRDSLTYYFDLINSEGIVVDVFDDADLDQDAGLDFDSVWFRKAGELYERARRNALGSDKVLDSILNELDDIIPF